MKPQPTDKSAGSTKIINLESLSLSAHFATQSHSIKYFISWDLIECNFNLCIVNQQPLIFYQSNNSRKIPRMAALYDNYTTTSSSSDGESVNSEFMEDLSWNGLTDIPSGAIARAPSLLSLQLSHNSILQLPASIAAFAKLVSLDVSSE